MCRGVLVIRDIIDDWFGYTKGSITQSAVTALIFFFAGVKLYKQIINVYSYKGIPVSMFN